MIKSYRDKRTREFVSGVRVRAFHGIEKQAQRRLELLDAAVSPDALRTIPSNRFEALHGDRVGQLSIRINDRWRICFEWAEGDDGPSDVEIVDYH